MGDKTWKHKEHYLEKKGCRVESPSATVEDAAASGIQTTWRRKSADLEKQRPQGKRQKRNANDLDSRPKTEEEGDAKEKKQEEANEKKEDGAKQEQKKEKRAKEKDGAKKEGN